MHSEAESKVLVLCIVFIERRRLARPLRSLSSSASRDSVPAAITVPWRLRRSEVLINRQSPRSGSATMYDIKPVRSMFVHESG